MPQRRRITAPGHFAGAVFDLKMSSISRISRDIASEMEQRAETVPSMSKNSHYPRLVWQDALLTVKCVPFSHVDLG